MSTPTRFSDGQYKNWLKCSHSLIIMKETLHDYTDNEVRKLHGDITLKVSSIQSASSTGNQCGSCSSKNIRLTGKPGNWSITCKNSICDKWLQQILAVHNDPHNPSINWKNADISMWPIDCYQVAKVFMPKGQNKTVKMPDDLDAPAILSLLKYCNWFRKDLPNPQILSDLIEIRNKVLHSGDLRVSDSNKDSWIDLMIQLLKDLKINGDTISNLETLKKEDIDINFRETEIRLLQEMVSVLVSDINTVKEDMATMLNSVSDLSENMEEVRFRTTETIGKVDAVNTDIEEIRKSLEEHRVICDKIVLFLDKNSIHDSEMRKNITSIEMKIMNLQSDLSRVEKEHKARISSLEKHSEETKVEIKGIKERKEETKEQIKEIQRRLLADEIQNKKLSLQTDVASSDWKKEIQEMFIDTFCKEKLEIFLSVKRNDSVLTYLLQVTLAKNSKEALCVIMAYINKKFQEDLNDKTIAVWLGLEYEGNKKSELVLVCFHSAYTVAKISQLAELRVIYRRFDEIEMEPMENRLQEKRESVSFTKHDVAAIKRLISEHGKDLFKIHSNLEAISASPIRSTKRGIINETSIVLYCRLKGVIPYGEEFFPKELKVDGQRYPTDIREGFFSLGMRRAQRQRSTPHPNFLNNPLRMGCSIGASGFPCAGTLGPFVRIGNDIGFLTCAHVLGINSISPKNVVQPSDIESGLPHGTRLCGTFVRENFDASAAIGVDAALVRIDQTQRDVAQGCFVWRDSNQPKKIGMFEGDSPSFVDGEVIRNPDIQRLWNQRDVCKFGRTTGLTQGLLVLENAMLKVHDACLSLPYSMPLPNGYPSNNFIMNGQFLIQNVGTEPFFAPGDSGAGVYIVRRNGQGECRLALIGIAIGSITAGECVMTPIGRVLEALQLQETDIITEGPMDID